MTTPEYRTMVGCTVSLTHTLASDIENIGDVFFEKGFIAPGVHDTTKSHIKEPKEKSSVLVSALTNKVKTSSQCFHSIVLILMKQGGWINGLIEKLRTTYKGKQDRMHILSDFYILLFREWWEELSSNRSKECSKY